MLRAAAQQGDLIVTSGGVSVGGEDHVGGVVRELGSVDLRRLAIKPGKPLAFGQVAGTPILGLPGNPVSAFVTFCLFGRPYVLRMQGLEDVLPRPITARACF
jgi:molybdopterin molybdotransferase